MVSQSTPFVYRRPTIAFAATLLATLPATAQKNQSHASSIHEIRHVIIMTDLIPPKS